MAANVEGFLAQHATAPISYMQHADQTVGELYNSLTPEQKDVVDTVIGAAMDGVQITDTSIVNRYDGLSQVVKDMIDFIVGGALASEIEHSIEMVDGFLAHYGVKGMKWGVRHDPDSGVRLSKSTANSHATRSAARAKVRAGTADLSETHLAAVKSKGHRVANAFLGDKQYWKTGLKISVASAAGIAASFGAPEIMPSGLLRAIGEHVASNGGAHASVAGRVMNESGHLVKVTDLGKQAATAAGITATYIAANVAGFGSSVTNLGRAIRGNKRVDSSYNALGNNLVKNQRSGGDAVEKVLWRSGGLSKRKVRANATSDTRDLEDTYNRDSAVRDILDRQGYKP